MNLKETIRRPRGLRLDITVVLTLPRFGDSAETEMIVDGIPVRLESLAGFAW